MGFLTPSPPDPKETAAAQTGTNVSTAVANAFLGNVNQKTPYGRKTYNVTGNYNFKDPTTGKNYRIPTFTEKVALNRHGKRLQGMNRKTERNLAGIAADQSGAIRDHLSKPINTEGLPEAGDASMIGDGSATRDRVEKALMDRMNPYLERDREALQSRLSNSGIKLGSEAFDRGMQDFGRQANDARYGAILNAGQEASREQAMDINKFNAMNTGRERALGELFAVRNQPLNEIAALMSGSQVTMPQFGATNMPNIPTVDYAGLVNQNYQQRLANSNALLGGLFGVASAGVGGAFS